MRTPRSIGLWAIAVALAAPADAAGRRDRCEPAVNGEIERLRVDTGDIGGISYQVRTHETNRGNTRTDRILAWVDLKSCTGKLVIELSPNCRVKQAYTTFACSVPGVPAY